MRICKESVHACSSSFKLDNSKLSQPQLTPNAKTQYKNQPVRKKNNNNKNNTETTVANTFCETNENALR